MSEATCVRLMTCVFSRIFSFNLTGSARLAALSAIEQEEQQPSEERRGSFQASEAEVVDPDDFDHDWKMKPKNHEVATAHAELVMEDRMRLELELHYDEVFRASWSAAPQSEHTGDAVPRRAGAKHVQHRVLECVRHRRYETLGLPDQLRRVLQHPRHEKNKMVIEEVADVLRMLCCKGREIHLRRTSEVDALIADVTSSKTGKLR